MLLARAVAHKPSHLSDVGPIEYRVGIYEATKAKPFARGRGLQVASRQLFLVANHPEQLLYRALPGLHQISLAKD